MSGDEAAKAQAEYVPVPVSLESDVSPCSEMPRCCEMPPGDCCDNCDCCETPAEATYTIDEPNIFEEAARITSTDRNQTYGPPRDNHSRTAALWKAYLSGLNGRPLDYRDVCWLNVLQKASRDVFSPGRDNLIDAAGYLRNIEMADNDEGR